MRSTGSPSCLTHGGSRPDRNVSVSAHFPAPTGKRTFEWDDGDRPGLDAKLAFPYQRRQTKYSRPDDFFGRDQPRTSNARTSRNLRASALRTRETGKEISLTASR